MNRCIVEWFGMETLIGAKHRIREIFGHDLTDHVTILEKPVASALCGDIFAALSGGTEARRYKRMAVQRHAATNEWRERDTPLP
ncbi:hypothetical protein H8E77_31010, partial [bacterium]|nr:hypothetical protein [bacterium]